MRGARSSYWLSKVNDVHDPNLLWREQWKVLSVDISPIDSSAGGVHSTFQILWFIVWEEAIMQPQRTFKSKYSRENADKTLGGRVGGDTEIAWC